MMAKVAVVGCGYWGKNLARNFYQLKSLAAICDSSEEILTKQRGKYPDILLTKDIKEVLNNRDIDALSIAVPTEHHFSLSKEALLHSKDVMVEKPLALNHRDGLELIRLAEEKNRILMVGHLLEYHPAVNTLYEIVKTGELGELNYIYSHRLNLGKVRQEENILWSFAPHDISIILNLTGEMPLVVNSSGGSYLQPTIADVTVTNLLFANGIGAHIFVSWLHPYKEQKLVVIGSRKMAVFDDVAREGKLKIYDKGIEWKNGVPFVRQTAESTLFFAEEEPLQLECSHFLHCIRERVKPRTDGNAGLQVLKVLEASQLSLERGGESINMKEIE
jgi:UDP-2-acetamido-3-amino-2,3-dideoxy-glucuronate N-acetyltransferase